MDYNINFPHLHIYMKHVGQEILIGGFSIKYYGLVVGLGLIVGIAIACYQAKKTGQDPNHYIDLSIVTVLSAFVGARIYYVAFRWDIYKENPISVFYIREGGLAIYGGIIAAIIATFIYCKIRKEKFGLVVDTAGLGLVIGQVIGRWGNFFNREAFGGYTDNLLAMQIPLSAIRSSEITEQQIEHMVTLDGVNYIQAHPTFLYESIWNLVLFIVLMLFTKHKKFDGHVFLLYLCGYGIGRFWIESLRTDQLLLPVIHYPVSKALAGVLVIVSLIWMGWASEPPLQVEEKDERTSGTSGVD